MQKANSALPSDKRVTCQNPTDKTRTSESTKHQDEYHSPRTDNFISNNAATYATIRRLKTAMEQSSSHLSDKRNRNTTGHHDLGQFFFFE